MDLVAEYSIEIVRLREKLHALEKIAREGLNKIKDRSSLVDIEHQSTCRETLKKIDELMGRLNG